MRIKERELTLTLASSGLLASAAESSIISPSQCTFTSHPEGRLFTSPA